MSYQALARRLRPRNFSDMVEQSHVVNALKNALDRKQLHHAYLFSGTRGVGKTTLARIFAKSLNCELGVSSHPCGECEICRAVDQGNFVDLLEIDAASRTGVEDTREILANVLYAPTKGRYKVYLIDEVHMLSTHSFNALLKTLEEPPAYVKFLLATTDPAKLPATVVSRCLHFALHKLTTEQIYQYLQHVLAEMQIAFETEALQVIARVANGSMRDGLSILEMALSYADPLLTLAGVNAMLGFAHQDLLWRILSDLGARDAGKLFWSVHELIRSGADLAQSLQEIVRLINQLAMYNMYQQVIDLNYEEAQVRQHAGHFSLAELQELYRIAGNGLRDLIHIPDKINLEMTLLRMLEFLRNGPQGASLTPQAQKLPEKQATSIPTAQAITKMAPPATASVEKKGAGPSGRLAERNAERIGSDLNLPDAPASAQEVVGKHTWPQILQKLNLGNNELRSFERFKLLKFSDVAISLGISAADKLLLTAKRKEKLSLELSKLFGRTLNLSFIEMKDLASDNSGGAPAMENIRRDPEQVIRSDRNLAAIIDKFDGVLHEDSIKLVYSPQD